ncbi:RrF2 family transcriptional regulator [Enterococcus hermanniensis]|nr:Rrf2 family transcriptional regulator [Enterococcus hermanniensis]
MRLSKHVEEALYVILILATQKEHQPLKSNQLSEILNVSDSSLKKVLRQLVVNELIISSASKDGGFELKKKIKEITLLDIVEAIESNTLITYTPNNVAETIFSRKEHARKSEQYFIDGFNQASEAYAAALKKIKIATILEEESIRLGTIDWAKIILSRKENQHEIDQ